MRNTRSNGPRRPRATPRVEGLESWTLLSGLAGLVPRSAVVHSLPAAGGVHAAAAAPVVTLNGPIHGIFSAYLPAADAGVRFTFNTAGKFSGAGVTIVTGSVNSLGNVASGHASGNLTLTTARGKVYMILTGPSQAGNSGLPSTLAYTVTGGTGGFKRATGQGTMDIAFGPLINPTITVGKPTTGTVTLTFHNGGTLA